MLMAVVEGWVQTQIESLLKMFIFNINILYIYIIFTFELNLGQVSKLVELHLVSGIGIVLLKISNVLDVLVEDIYSELLLTVAVILVVLILPVEPEIIDGCWNVGLLGLEELKRVMTRGGEEDQAD